MALGFETLQCFFFLQIEIMRTDRTPRVPWMTLFAICLSYLLNIVELFHGTCSKQKQSRTTVKPKSKTRAPTPPPDPADPCTALTQPRKSPLGGTTCLTLLV